MKKTISKVSEWIAAGGMKSGLYAVTATVEKTTEKAIGFAAKRFNQAGNLVAATCWFPKSKAVEIEDDFYDEKKKTFLVPEWLVLAKMNEGFEI